MKKFLFAVIACVCLGVSTSFAGHSPNPAPAIESAQLPASWYGTFMAEDGSSQAVIVSPNDGGYVRIISNGTHTDLSFTESKDPWGNLTLTLYNRYGENSGIITYAGNRKLYYNDKSYVKNY